jgi:hypothetical protein
MMKRLNQIGKGEMNMKKSEKQKPTIRDLPLPGMTWEQSLKILLLAKSKGDLQDWTGSLPFHLNKEKEK